MRARRRMRYSAVIRGDDVRPMTSTNFGHRAGPAALAGMRGRRRGAPFAPLVVLTVLILGAVGFVAYVLWPRWPGPPVAADARTIYPRYIAAHPTDGPNGLALRAFRDGTPYQGEDLIYSTDEPDRFVLRCTRNGAGPMLGMCLYERRIEQADLVVRFPRDWLND